MARQRLEGGFTDTRSTLAILVVIVGGVVVGRYWGALPGWAKVAAGVAGALVLGLGLLGGGGGWPRSGVDD